MAAAEPRPSPLTLAIQNSGRPKSPEVRVAVEPKPVSPAFSPGLVPETLVSPQAGSARRALTIAREALTAAAEYEAAVKNDRTVTAEAAELAIFDANHHAAITASECLCGALEA